MLATSITLPLEMLRAAWSMAKVKSPSLPALEIEFRAESAAVIPTQTGIQLPAQPLSTPPKKPAIIFVPALWRDPIRIIKQHPKTVRWIAAAARVQTIAAVGTGVCFLAEAGTLNNRMATTHWHFSERFSKRYPLIQLKQDLFITRSERLFCTASINALAEVTAFFIQELFGLPIAQAVERNFFHEIRQPRTQAELNPHSATTTDETIALAVTLLDGWAATQNQLSQSMKVQDLAEQLGISVRTLNRRFQQAIGLSPLQYLQRKKLGIAEELLKTSNLAVADIANHSGYTDPQLLTRHFKKAYGLAPSQYRYTVRGKIFT